MKIAIDLDEVLSQEMNAFLKWFNNKYDTNWTFDDVTDYHWSNFLGISEKQAIEDAYEFFKTDEFANLSVHDDAQAGIKELSQKHKLYIVTARQNGIKDLNLFHNSHIPLSVYKITCFKGFEDDEHNTPGKILKCSG